MPVLIDPSLAAAMGGQVASVFGSDDDLMGLHSQPHIFFTDSPPSNPPHDFASFLRPFAMLPPPCRNPPPAPPPPPPPPPPRHPSGEDPELTPGEMMLSPEIRQFVSHRESLLRLLSEPIFKGVDPADPCFQQFYRV
jgi:hypothetical protein